jgi:hypothetical protein
MVEPVEQPATAHNIAQMLIAAILPPVRGIAAMNHSVMVVARGQGWAEASRLPAMVAGLELVEATHWIAAWEIVVVGLASRQLVVASRIVAVARDWAATEVEQLRSYRKSENSQEALLRNWRIVAC